MEARREAADNLKPMLRISKRQVALYNVLKTTMRLKRRATDKIANLGIQFSRMIKFAIYHSVLAATQDRDSVEKKGN